MLLRYVTVKILVASVGGPQQLGAVWPVVKTALCRPIFSLRQACEDVLAKNWHFFLSHSHLYCPPPDVPFMWKFTIKFTPKKLEAWDYI